MPILSTPLFEHSVELCRDPDEFWLENPTNLWKFLFNSNKIGYIVAWHLLPPRVGPLLKRGILAGLNPLDTPIQLC